MPEENAQWLSGLRILVVEDEFILADLLTVMLEDLGCVVVGPFPDTRSGLRAIEADVIDGAVIDANLGNGATSVPIAKALQDAALPFVVSTGYGSLISFDEALQRAPKVMKPFKEADLKAALAAAFGQQSSVHNASMNYDRLGRTSCD